MRTQWLLIGALSAALLGCGGSKSSDTDYRKLQLADDKIAPLRKPAGQQSFATYLKNGMRLQLQGSGTAVPEEPTAMPGTPEADSSGTGNSGNFSTTNVHVEGVDEADRVKYDGDHLYIAMSPHFSYHYTDDGYNVQRDGNGIRIVRTLPEQAGAEEVAHVDLNDSDFNISALYLVTDAEGATRDVSAISHKQSYGDGIWLWNPYRHGGNDSIEIRSFEVTTPAEPTDVWKLELDGALAQSRKIGNILYLVSRFSPVIEGLEFYPTSASQRSANEQLIAAATTAQLLPRYRINDGDSRSLVSSDDCYVPENLEQGDGYAELVTISAIDLNSRELVSSVCLNTRISGLYTSTSNLYLGTSAGDHAEQVTGIHKFSLNQGQIDYRGTGVVPGYIGWRAASFRMDEYQDDLRIITTDYALQQEQDLDGAATIDIWMPTELDHRLTILREQAGSNRLQQVAILPNDARPDEIGKPGEDIYAVRFLRERAYVVTFEQIDPLYILDLSNSNDPYIAGELEVPGFSTYLHPIGEDYLLGIGGNVSDGRTDGVKVELYDVRDTSNPQTLGTQVIGQRGTYSPALHDLRALNFLRVNDDQLRFTLPVDVSEDYWWQYSALYLYEINGLTGAAASLNPGGNIMAELPEGDEPGWYYNSNGYNARSRLHDDTVYFIYGNDVWSAFWQTPDAATGPL